MKKILSAIFTASLVLSMLVLPAGAAEKLTPEENNAQIIEQAESLEKKYGINIAYPVNANGYSSITMNNLETLDLAFSTITPSVVKQVSGYYQQLNGRKIEINYVFSDSGYNYNGAVLMAAFERATSKIYVFMPATAGRAVISGENPVALVHEFGHAFHLMCMDIYGAQKMRDEWVKFNDGHRYSPNGGFFNPDEDVFISGYASTSFEEDFAETFAHTLVRNASGTGFKAQLSRGSEMTGLGLKVNYIKKLLVTYISDSQEAVNNYNKIYSTSDSKTFEGINFSGSYLQYIGYPQPRNILKGILNELQVTSQKSTWVRSLGAWRVIDENGDTCFIFPGGNWIRVQSDKLAS